MTRVFMNGKQIPKEELKNYVATFDPNSKQLLGLKKREGGGEGENVSNGSRCRAAV
ncbi:MAG: hypothetical protein NC094_12055 [Bacteroidales bacterium]|nr:hypothetical protein [Lachnoclostridium sp.]MCM1385271.1 hypothetical protein [Lachnoclostridium sp.]MCM1466143.1 hypothetical protein [Bacteroidales bacterium]